jgi:hypothetical protein
MAEQRFATEYYLATKNILPMYGSNRYRGLMEEALQCEEVGSGRRRRDLTPEEYRRKSDGLGCKILPSILSECRSEEAARRVLDFATTLALHTGSKRVTKLGARLALRFGNDPRSLEILSDRLLTGQPSNKELLCALRVWLSMEDPVNRVY